MQRKIDKDTMKQKQAIKTTNLHPKPCCVLILLIEKGVQQGAGIAKPQNDK